MIDKRTISGLTDFLLNHKDPNLSKFSLYNEWSLTQNVVIKDKNDVLTIMNFIDNFNSANKRLIEIAYNVDAK